MAEADTMPIQLTEELLGIPEAQQQAEQANKKMTGRLSALMALYRVGLLVEQALAERASLFDTVEVSKSCHGYGVCLTVVPPDEKDLALWPELVPLMQTPEARTIALERFLEVMARAARTFYCEKGKWNCAYSSGRVGHHVHIHVAPLEDEVEETSHA